MKTKISLLICFLGLTLLTHAQLLAPETYNTKNFPAGSYPPGYVDPIDWTLTCFSYMGTVESKPAYRFITSYYGATPPTGWTGGKLNPEIDRLAGFSIPLVGDLDGDGYPEIIGVGQIDGGTSLYGYYEYIYIYSGQDGKKIAKLPLTAANGTVIGLHTSGGFHQSPSIAAIVDSDRNGTIEIILSFPRAYHKGGTSAIPYTNAVASYNINVDPTTKVYSLEHRWVSSEKYHFPASNEFQRVTPQIVDFDGDGVAEVLVYNKIYNAQTGDLLLTMETMGTDAFVGTDMVTFGGEANRDRYQSFNYVYDMDGDGIYDVAAGGKVYKIAKDAGGIFSYTIVTMPGVPDGRTGVADINGDGIADVVTTVRTADLAASDLRIVVWNPGFQYINGNGDIVNNVTPDPRIIAETTVKFDNTADVTGSYSYVYIGDIDGREQVVGGKTYRLPEISILSRGPNVAAFSRHPNIAGIAEGDGGIPATHNYATAPIARGAIFSYTYDAQAGDLKGSFIMEHQDRSIDTGFTLFDFDNDGVQEICYRDEKTLRIIKPTIPFVKNGNTDPKVILFEKSVFSFTGFEYPVIADIDNDASAEMVVVGHNLNADYCMGYVYAVGSDGDKFAPALPMWNQFMYDPFKINTNLTTPWAGAGNIYKAPNRLEMKYNFTRLVKDKDGTVTKVMKEFSPYNGTLIQMSKYMLQSQEHEGTTYDNVFEPIIFLTHAYIIDENGPEAKRPKVKTATKQIEFYIGNGANAETDIALSTPITVYENTIENIGNRKTYQKTLGELGLTSAIKAGVANETLVKFPIDDAFGFYIIRVGDASENLNTASPTWHFGVNDQADMDAPGFEAFDDGIAPAKRAYRDCDWTDQTGKASAFMLYNDPRTIQEYSNVAIDVLDNDILPTDFNIAIKGFTILTQPTAGKLDIAGKIITYTHTAKAPLDDCIDKFTYQIEYVDPTNSANIIKRDATAYIYVLQGAAGGFEVCYGAEYNLKLKLKPDGVTFKWFADATTTTQITPDPTLAPIPNVQNNLHYFVEPIIPEANVTYKSIVFPRGELLIEVIKDVNNKHRVLQWTGTINSDWNNPHNWKEVLTGGILADIKFAPTPCVDVIVPMVITNYPELNVASQSAKLTIQDRGMIKNTFLLDYDEAKIELELGTEDHGRWISFSNILDQVFSGAYMMGKRLPHPGPTVSRSTYLALYEKDQPANDFSNPIPISASAAVAKQFTEPTEAPNILLSLDRPFVFYVDDNYSRITKLALPDEVAVNSYGQAANNPIGTAEKILGSYNITLVANRFGRFHYENYTPNATTGEFSLAMDSYSEYVLISNPYPAYISVNKFLEANTIFVADEYMVWTGTKTDDFATRENAKTRFWKVKDSATMIKIVTAAPDVLIPPFQSFFVKRKDTTGNSITIKYLPQTMSVTKVEVGGYKLR